jgi:hypothetical protein
MVAPTVNFSFLAASSPLKPRRREMRKVRPPRKEKLRLGRLSDLCVVAFPNATESALIAREATAVDNMMPAY